MNTDVIIVGAGPTGLMAACQLARFGINFIIIDTKSKPTTESRALLVTARSLEIYQQMGLSDSILNTGNSVKEISVFIEGRHKLDFSIGNDGNNLTEFPCFHVFEQSKNEELLYESLKIRGHDVLWNTELISLELDEIGVVALVKNKLGSEDDFVIQAKYLVGCDGAKSKVRHLLNGNFSGGTYENKFFVIDAKIKSMMRPDKIVAAPSGKDFLAFFPMTEKDTFRILGTIPLVHGSQEHFSSGELGKFIKEGSPFPVEIIQINWSAIYQLHYRCVDNFQFGRCFLAGDAAHIHSPAGGQGMNTGLQDAYNLSWKLAMVLRKYSPPELLYTYHTERHPFALWLLKFTDRLFQLITSRNIFISLLRKHLPISLIIRLSGNKGKENRFFKRFSQIWYSYNRSILSIHNSKQKLTFKAGDRLPYVMIENRGELKSCYHLLTEPAYHLLIIGQNQEVNEAFIASDNLQPIIITRHLALSESWEKLGVRKMLYILVRPDNYIGLLADNMQPGILDDYFKLCKIRRPDK